LREYDVDDPAQRVTPYQSLMDCGQLRQVHRYAEVNDIPVIHFGKADNKEAARPLMDAAEADGGDGRVALIGVAQEKAPVWRSRKVQGRCMPPIRTWSGVGRWHRQPFLLLPVGCGLGWGVLEDQRARPVADLDPAQRAHLGPSGSPGIGGSARR
jgi:hypothetical protein